MKQRANLSEELMRLGDEVSEFAGFEITCTRDCEVLSDELRSFDGRFPVSVSTLRRFFGLIPSESQFSSTTLNSLARYVGYRSFREWSKRHRLDKASSTARSTIAQVPEKLSVTPSTDSPENWTKEQAELKIKEFIQSHSNPDNFQLTASQFGKVKHAMFALYQRGILDMGLWMEFTKLTHLKEFILEHFPPLDFMNSFGQPLMEEYIRTADSPLKKHFALGVIASGKIARGEPWQEVLPILPSLSQPKPNVHPLVYARNTGIRMLGLKESGANPQEYEGTRESLMWALKHSDDVWPRWSHQSCYVAFNLSDWATLAQDLEMIEACRSSIVEFRQRQDLYHRSSDIDNVLDIRMIWHDLMLGNIESAEATIKRLQWDQFQSMESRTLSIWYHAAHTILGQGDVSIHRANFNHYVALTGYKGFGNRIQRLLDRIQS